MKPDNSSPAPVYKTKSGSHQSQSGAQFSCQEGDEDIRVWLIRLCRLLNSQFGGTDLHCINIRYPLSREELGSACNVGIIRQYGA